MLSDADDLKINIFSTEILTLFCPKNICMYVYTYVRMYIHACKEDVIGFSGFDSQKCHSSDCHESSVLRHITSGKSTYLCRRLHIFF